MSTLHNNLTKAIDSIIDSKLECYEILLDEKIEEMNEALTETQKELQAVRDEKSILEKKLQEIQETLKEKKQNKYMDKNENLVERIARW